jgi:putative MATE family efflux protein
MPLALMNTCLMAYFYGVLDTKTPMRVAIFTAVVNAVLDVALVFGVGNWQGLGVTGAGLATLIAQLIGMALLMNRLHQLSGRAVGMPTFQSVLRQPMKFVTGVGIDLFLRGISLNLVFFIGVVLASRLGAAHVAAHNIVLQLWYFGAHTTDALAIAARSLTGEALGARDPDKAVLRGKAALRVSLVIGVVQMAAFAALTPWAGRAFTGEAAVLALFSAPYWVLVFSQPMNSVSFTLDGILKGAGDAAFLRTWIIVGTLLGFLPVALILTPRIGLPGVWLGIVALMLIRSTSIVLRFYSRKWLDVSARVFDLGAG